MDRIVNRIGRGACYQIRYRINFEYRLYVLCCDESGFSTPVIKYYNALVNEPSKIEGANLTVACLLLQVLQHSLSTTLILRTEICDEGL